MAYDTYELSNYDGAPVELILFKDDVAQQQWAFTTGEDALIEGLLTFIPDIINRSGIKAGGSEITGSIQIKVPVESAIAQQFKTYLPSRPIGVNIRRFHFNDVAEQLVTLFIGQVTTVAFENDGMATLNCDSVVKALTRKVPWQLYKGGCNNALYEFGCGVSRDLFVEPATAYALAGTTLTSIAFGANPDGWFNNGYVEVPSTGERRYIIGHVGNVLTLDYPLFTAVDGEAINAYAGCDRTRQTCKDKFNNLPNMLAFDWIPETNPYDTNLGPSQAGGSSKASTVLRALIAKAGT
jgi:uncharacterized phage protein (TIGR02218 family)